MSLEEQSARRTTKRKEGSLKTELGVIELKAGARRVHNDERAANAYNHRVERAPRFDQYARRRPVRRRGGAAARRPA